MRATPILPLLLVVGLMVAACGPATVLAGAPTPHQVGADALETGTRTGIQAPGAPVDAPPRRILFIGASLTEGWYASTRDRTYTALVASGLAQGRRVRVR